MSRIGKKPILIPAGVTVTVNTGRINVKGPKGELHRDMRPEILAQVEGNQITFTIANDNKEANAFWGLERALIANMVLGVSEHFTKKLELVGVGYRVKQAGTALAFTLGFSHPVEFPAPEGITLTAVDQTNITISGADKMKVGQVAAQIRKLRKPEPYKGKGIKYQNEHIRRKAGKSAKA